ncbi:MAG: hypothetical protein JSV95_02890 [Gemmatimonadota bacterium]|jgi:hypothetical protein|nr:MAG: hypothetical protein JSV95_02890 [Gemmatimonadota bacterium]
MKPTPERRHPWRLTPPRRPGLLVGLLLAGACSPDAEPLEEPPRDPREVIAGRPDAPSPTPAEYATELAFVGFARQPVRLYARFVNETSADTLLRRYAGWLESGGEWRLLSALEDVLPVPRAAWRILPGGPWKVMAANGGELAGLRYRDTVADFRLTPGELVAEWTGETGQREALLLARLQRGDSIQNGLLVFRRAARLRSDGADESARPRADARSIEAPAVGLRTQLFLLVDSLSNGLLVARDATDPDSTAIGWTWVGSIGNEWADVRVRPPPEGASRALARWQIEVPEAGVRARFRLEPLPPAEPDGPSDPAPLPFALQGRLEILGSERPAAGLAVEDGE